MNFLRRNERKTFIQIESHLVPKNTERSRTRPIGLLCAVIENMLDEFEIILHFYT